VSSWLRNKSCDEARGARHDRDRRHQHRVRGGRHRFDVQPLGEGRSRFVQSERLSGALVPLFRSMLTGPTPEAFAAMNDALAKRALDAL
jgi:hypothetical protein